jgi:hypothetical protein
MAKLNNIKDKDKLWIVYNVNIAGMTKQAAIGVIDHINKELSTPAVCASAISTKRKTISWARLRKAKKQRPKSERIILLKSA